MSPIVSTYSERNAILAKLGYTSYAAYLATPLWGWIRRRVFEEKGQACYICTRHAWMVHHEFYSEDNLKGRVLAGLRPICGKCHQEIEVRDGRKLPNLYEVRRAAKELKADVYRITNFHAPALPKPSPAAHHWQCRQLAASAKKVPRKPDDLKQRKAEKKRLRALNRRNCLEKAVRRAQKALDGALARYEDLTKYGRRLRAAKNELAGYLRAVANGTA